MKHPLLGMMMLAATSASIPAEAVPFLGPAKVTTAGTLYRYDGPLGAGIYNVGSGPVTGSEQTWFRDRARAFFGGAGVEQLRFDP